LKRKLSLPLTLFMISLFFIPSAFAQTWEPLQEPYGIWQTCERTLWETINGDNYGNMSWQIDVANFTGYHAEYYATEMSNYRLAWWHESSSKNFIIKQKFQINETHCFILWVWFKSYQTLWGAIYKNVVMMDITLSEEESCDFVGEYSVGGLNSYAVADVWYNSSTQQLKVYLYHIADGYRDPEVCLDWSVNSTDLENITITQSIYHYGVGKFAGFMSDSIYQNEPYSPTIPETAERITHDIWHFINNLSNLIGQALPAWLRDWINSLGGYFEWLIGILAIVWNGVTLSVQFFPAIILFWFLDAIITSVHEGDLHPIGNCFMTIYNFARGVISTIVAIIGRIWDFITFWS